MSECKTKAHQAAEAALRAFQRRLGVSGTENYKLDPKTAQRVKADCDRVIFHAECTDCGRSLTVVTRSKA